MSPEKIRLDTELVGRVHTSVIEYRRLQKDIEAATSQLEKYQRLVADLTEQKEQRVLTLRGVTETLIEEGQFTATLQAIDSRPGRKLPIRETLIELDLIEDESPTP